MNLKERLLAYLDYKGIKKASFEKGAGFSNGFVDKMGDNTRTANIDKISNYFPDLNVNWLRTGEGSMLKTAQNAVGFTPLRHAGIPLVSQYAYAGYLGGYGDPDYMESLPTIDFTPDREMTGKWIAFEVRGDSMDDGTKDGYVEGEIVICREVEREFWKDSHLYINKRDFVIVHEEGILIKRIVKHDVPGHTITIHSLNPMYQDRIINLSGVKQIFSIVESRIQRRRM